MRITATLLSVYLLLSGLLSCNSKAVSFNNRLVTIQKSVLKEVQEFGKETQKANADSLPASVTREAKRITSFISNKINKVSALLVPKKGGDLKKAILKQLEFERDIVEKIGRLASPGISKDVEGQIQIQLLNSQHKAKELESAVRAAQEAFARDNNFELEK